MSSATPSPRAGATGFLRPRLLTADLLIKVGSLLFSLVLVWWIYARWVHPHAENVAIENRLMSQTTEGYVPPRDIAVIIKDPEQQFEITFWIWAMVLLAVKLSRISKENQMLGRDYLLLDPGERILPEESLAYFKDLKAAVESRPGWSERILPNAILSALHRFHSTQSIMDAAQAAKERSEVAGNEMEADLSLIRYIAWAIPALGFIGTVRGIGEALAQAERAISGELGGVVDALGLAFNSTLVALLLSMVLMFLLHLLQGRQDKLILDIQNFCDHHVVAQMKVPAQESGAPAFQI